MRPPETPPATRDPAPPDANPSPFGVLHHSSPALLWLSDLANTCFVNHAFEEFVGEQASMIRDADVVRFVHPDDRRAFEEGYRQALAAQRRFEARARFRRADGTYWWMKAVAAPRFAAGNRLVGYVGCLLDVTDMQDAQAAVLEMDRGKNEFLAMLAHELRNPLSGVRNACRILAESHDPAAIEEARHIIDRQTGAMVRMIDDLLDVARMDQGKIQLRVEAVDLVKAVRNCIAATEHERREKDLALDVAMPDAPLWLDGDPMRLEQIVCNLLNNASKFTRRGGRVWVSVDRDAQSTASPHAVLRVRDNGMGIEPTLLPRIFELFVQADRHDDRARSGIGLGLTLARRLVQLHGGTIEASSAGTGHGSEFVVRVPLATPEEAGAQREHVRLKAAGEPRRVLIVDDNRDSAESMRLMFMMAGHEVEVVNDGASAQPAALRFQPHAILLDIGLPDTDGYTVARELRQHPRMRDVVIVAITGYGRDEDVRKSQEAGIDDHMVKPIDPDRVLERLGRGRKP